MKKAQYKDNAQNTQVHNDVFGWRKAHIGYWLAHANHRFDKRVWQLISTHPDAPLALSNLVEQGRITAGHINITRHLPLEGTRLMHLASYAGMTKQAMWHLVAQCKRYGLVTCETEQSDRRAICIKFTSLGESWLHAFKQSVEQAKQEFEAELGPDVATVVALGLEAYATTYHYDDKR